MRRKGNRYKKGKYHVVNTHKYLGDLTQVEYRSGWEHFFMEWLDINPNVKHWNSEGVVVQYFSKMDQKSRRYYVDFYVEFINGDKFIYEVKPFKQTQPPKFPTKTTSKSINRFQKEKYDFNVNLDKWSSANDSARLSGMKFRILTENDLQKIGMRL